VLEGERPGCDSQLTAGQHKPGPGSTGVRRDNWSTAIPPPAPATLLHAPRRHLPRPGGGLRPRPLLPQPHRHFARPLDRGRWLHHPGQAQADARERRGHCGGPSSRPAATSGAWWWRQVGAAVQQPHHRGGGQPGGVASRSRGCGARAARAGGRRGAVRGGGGPGVQGWVGALPPRPRGHRGDVGGCAGGLLAAAGAATPLRPLTCSGRMGPAAAHLVPQLPGPGGALVARPERPLLCRWCRRRGVPGLVVAQVPPAGSSSSSGSGCRGRQDVCQQRGLHRAAQGGPPAEGGGGSCIIAAGGVMLSKGRHRGSVPGQLQLVASAGGRFGS
jgi:hypothetical protein